MKYCLGTVQFGIDYGVQGGKQPEFEDVSKILDYAITHNIDNFDTASAYGNAEKRLGKFVKVNPTVACNMRFISKLKPDAFAKKSIEEWGDIARQCATDSLNTIGINKFYAYLFHNAAYINDENAVRALVSVKKHNLAECIGASVYSPEEAMKALEFDEIDVIQVPYNVFDRRLDKCGFFDKAHKKGVKVYARSSLLQGLVVMEPDNLPKQMQFAQDYLIKFRDICRDYDMSALQTAIGCVAQKQGIDYIVFGVDNINQLQEYIALQDTHLPEEMIDRIDTTFDEVEERFVNPSMW